MRSPLYVNCSVILHKSFHHHSTSLSIRNIHNMYTIGRVHWQQMRTILVILAALTWTTTSLQPEDRVSAFYQTLHGGVRLNSHFCVISCWSFYCIYLHTHIFFAWFLFSNNIDVVITCLLFPMFYNDYVASGKHHG